MLIIRLNADGSEDRLTSCRNIDIVILYIIVRMHHEIYIIYIHHIYICYLCIYIHHLCIYMYIYKYIYLYNIYIYTYIMTLTDFPLTKRIAKRSGSPSYGISLENSEKGNRLGQGEPLRLTMKNTSCLCDRILVSCRKDLHVFQMFFLYHP